MSIQTLLQPNNLKLYGDIAGGDIAYDTLTQNNGNSFVDSSGNAKLGNCQAGDINAVNLNASTGITSGNLGVNTTGPINCVNLTATGVTTLGDPLDNGLTFDPANGNLRLYDQNGNFNVWIRPESTINSLGGCISLLKSTNPDVSTLITPDNLAVGGLNTLTAPGMWYFGGTLYVSRPSGYGGSCLDGRVDCELVTPAVSTQNGILTYYSTTNSSNYNIGSRPFGIVVLESGVTSITLPNVPWFISFCNDYGINYPLSPGPLGFASNIYFDNYIVNNTGGPVTINNSPDGKVISNTASVPNSTNIINYKFVVIDSTGAATPSVIMY
jgi:hypothetical protein